MEDYKNDKNYGEKEESWEEECHCECTDCEPDGEECKCECEECHCTAKPKEHCCD